MLKKDKNWRWQFIKKVVSNKRSTLWNSRTEKGKHGTDKNLAKRMISSPVRDLKKYRKVMKWLKKNNVYISMTSSPKRLSKLPAVLATIDTTYLSTIYLVLPFKFGRTKPIALAAPVDVGIIEEDAVRALLKSL